MDEPLWEFRRDHRFGEPEQIRLGLDEFGQPVLSMWNDHGEWDEVVLDAPAVNRLQQVLRQWITANGHTLRDAVGP